MANVQIGNSWYIDTAYASAADDLARRVSVYYIVVTATAAGAILVLSDPSSSSVKVELRVPTSGSSQVFRFDQLPLVFPNGVRVTTLTNAKATLIGEEQT
jgi:hypothetical protein